MKNISHFLESKSEIKKIIIPAKTTICELGDTCESLVVLTKGIVKIFRNAEDGRNFTLYHISPGEGCVLTAACLLNESTFPAFAITEAPSEGYKISKKLLKHWLKTEAEWQAFIFNLLTLRMGDLIEKVDLLAFETLETRLKKWLVDHSQAPNIKITHQQVADELASSREVVSRLLKKLEKNEKVKLLRGEIILIR